MTEHRWSGWPGAWCLDCGAGDPYEQALADDRFEWDERGNPIITDALRAEMAPLMVCAEPGSKRHDPYAARMEARRAANAKGGAVGTTTAGNAAQTQPGDSHDY